MSWGYSGYGVAGDGPIGLVYIRWVTPELRHLRYLLAVAEHGSFTRAAEDLHVSQPTLSQQIRQLERLVGAPLLDRTGRAVRLTDAGEVYARHARLALAELDAADRAVHDVEDLSRGHLRLAYTPTFAAYLIGPLIAELRARHPGITLDIRETNQDVIESGLLADDIDVGIGFAGGHLPGIEAATLFTETLSLVGADRRTARSRLPAAKLAEYDLALLNREFVTRLHIDAYFREQGVSPRILVEANSIHAVIEAVQLTELATILPDGIARDHPRLTTVALDPPLPTRIAVLLCRESAYRTAAARAFFGLARDWSARQAV